VASPAILNARRHVVPQRPRRGAQADRCLAVRAHLIRHGLAEERGDGLADDTKRPLTDEALSKMRKSVRGLAASWPVGGRPCSRRSGRSSILQCGLY